MYPLFQANRGDCVLQTVVLEVLNCTPPPRLHLSTYSLFALFIHTFFRTLPPQMFYFICARVALQIFHIPSPPSFLFVLPPLFFSPLLRTLPPAAVWVGCFVATDFYTHLVIATTLPFAAMLVAAACLTFYSRHYFAGHTVAGWPRGIGQCLPKMRLNRVVDQPSEMTNQVRRLESLKERYNIFLILVRLASLDGRGKGRIGSDWCRWGGSSSELWPRS